MLTHTVFGSVQVELYVWVESVWPIDGASLGYLTRSKTGLDIGWTPNHKHTYWPDPTSLPHSATAEGYPRQLAFLDSIFHLILLFLSFNASQTFQNSKQRKKRSQVTSPRCLQSDLGRDSVHFLIFGLATQSPFKWVDILLPNKWAQYPVSFPSAHGKLEAAQCAHDEKYKFSIVNGPKRILLRKHLETRGLPKCSNHWRFETSILYLQICVPMVIFWRIWLPNTLYNKLLRALSIYPTFFFLKKIFYSHDFISDQSVCHGWSKEVFLGASIYKKKWRGC